MNTNAGKGWKRSWFARTKWKYEFSTWQEPSGSRCVAPAKTFEESASLVAFSMASARAPNFNNHASLMKAVISAGANHTNLILQRLHELLAILFYPITSVFLYFYSLKNKNFEFVRNPTLYRYILRCWGLGSGRIY